MTQFTILLHTERYDWLDYCQSRQVADNTPTDEDNRKEGDEGKLSAEDFDKCFKKHNWPFYDLQLHDIEAALEIIQNLQDACDAHLSDRSPSFGTLREMYRGYTAGDRNACSSYKTCRRGTLSLQASR